MHAPWQLKRLASMSLGELDILYQIAATGKSKTNTCRNLHRLIHRQGLTVPVELSFVPIPVRKRRPLVREDRCLVPSHLSEYLGHLPIERLQLSSSGWGGSARDETMAAAVV